ncbi:MAG: GNAT family N-acetyltransferase [Phycisphaerae bacterium]
MNNSAQIVFAAASAEDLPAVVELCMAVEAQHERYWPLRWGRREGLSEGYLGWLNRRLNDPRMLILVAKDPALPGPHDLFGEGGAVVGMILVTIEKEIPIYTFSEFAYVQDIAVRETHRRRGISQRLLTDAAAWARRHQLTQLRLMVANQNPDGQAAFEKAGFRKTYQEMVLPL